MTNTSKDLYYKLAGGGLDFTNKNPEAIKQSLNESIIKVSNDIKKLEVEIYEGNLTPEVSSEKSQLLDQLVAIKQQFEANLEVISGLITSYSEKSSTVLNNDLRIKELEQNNKFLSQSLENLQQTSATEINTKRDQDLYAEFAENPAAEKFMSQLVEEFPNENWNFLEIYKAAISLFQDGSVSPASEKILSKIPIHLWDSLEKLLSTSDNGDLNNNCEPGDAVLVKLHLQNEAVKVLPKAAVARKDDISSTMPTNIAGLNTEQFCIPLILIVLENNKQTTWDELLDTVKQTVWDNGLQSCYPACIILESISISIQSKGKIKERSFNKTYNVSGSLSVRDYKLVLKNRIANKRRNQYLIKLPRLAIRTNPNTGIETVIGSVSRLAEDLTSRIEVRKGKNEVSCLLKLALRTTRKDLPQEFWFVEDVQLGGFTAGKQNDGLALALADQADSVNFLQ